MVGDVKVIVGVVVVKHAAGGKTDGESAPFRSTSTDLSCFSPEKETGQDLQLVDPIRSHEVREGGRGWRGWRWGGAAPPAVVVVASAPSQRHDVLEADVRLRGVVHAVRDRNHGDGVDGAAARPVAAAHQRTWEVEEGQVDKTDLSSD